MHRCKLSRFRVVGIWISQFFDASERPIFLYHLILTASVFVLTLSESLQPYDSATLDHLVKGKILGGQIMKKYVALLLIPFLMLTFLKGLPIHLFNAHCCAW